MFLPIGPGTADMGELAFVSEFAATSKESFRVFVTDSDGREVGGLSEGTDGLGMEVIIAVGPDVAMRIPYEC